MSRQRYQRGMLRTSVPGHGARPEQKLPRGSYWAQWFRYVQQPNGTEKRQRREKIITRDLAEQYRLKLDYPGPLTKGDAQRVLDLLIAADAGTYTPPNTQITLAMLAREYVDLRSPNWGPNMQRVACNLVDKHIVRGALGERPVVALELVELQRWINTYVQIPASPSLLSNLLYHTRAIFEHAIDRDLIERNPARKLLATSQLRSSKRALTIEECRRLLDATAGQDRLILRLFIQIGLRAEELFALRHNDWDGQALRIDEAIVEGVACRTKTHASEGSVHVPAQLAAELTAWAQCTSGNPEAWLFPALRGGPIDGHNYLARTLKPAAARAGVEHVNFQVLRRTCATLFGGIARDPKLTQAQLRHATPRITLERYQQAIPEELKAAAAQLEHDLFDYSDQALIRQEIQ